jgi:hypothetical protein
VGCSTTGPRVRDQLTNADSSTAVSHYTLSQNWYHAAVFCLNSADFMRIPSVRSVQAIAVLGIVFNLFGDTELGKHMWSCAMRIAQKIGLDTRCSAIAREHLTEEAQHRLW